MAVKFVKAHADTVRVASLAKVKGQCWLFRVVQVTRVIVVAVDALPLVIMVWP